MPGDLKVALLNLITERTSFITAPAFSGHQTRCWPWKEIKLYLMFVRCLVKLVRREWHMEKALSSSLLCLIANLRGHTVLQNIFLEGFRKTCHDALTTLAETHQGSVDLLLRLYNPQNNLVTWKRGREAIDMSQHPWFVTNCGRLTFT